MIFSRAFSAVVYTFDLSFGHRPLSSQRHTQVCLEMHLCPSVGSGIQVCNKYFWVNIFQKTSLDLFASQPENNVLPSPSSSIFWITLVVRLRGVKEIRRVKIVIWIVTK